MKTNRIIIIYSLTAASIFLFIFVHVMNTGLIFIGNSVYNALPVTNDAKTFFTGIVQQAVQALLALLIGLVILKKPLRDLGITIKNTKQSIQYFGIFALSWTIITVLYCTISYFFIPSFWQSMTSVPLPSGSKVYYTLLFQLVFPGIGEELLFRAAFIAILAVVLKRVEKNTGTHVSEKVKNIVFNLITAVLFAGAHIYFSTSPFKITHIDPVQQTTALACGFFYAFVYQKTGSLLAPFLCHNFANTLVTVCGWVIALL
jgi:uncharacterized protein